MSIKPPFHFRTASKQSRGVNTATHIDPLAGHESRYHESIAAIDLPALRPMVHDHIKFNYESPSQFSSWSVSVVLYVLVHVIRKTYSQDEDDVIIYVMDTSKLPTSRIRSAVELIKEYDLEWAENPIKYAQGEHLVHGKLEHTPGLWEGVVMVALIAVRKRDLSEDGMAVIDAGLQCMRLLQLPWSTSLSLRCFHQELGRVAEAQKFMQVLRLLHGLQHD